MEEAAMFKSYLRKLKRDLTAIKEALNENDSEKAEKTLDELIEDTQKGIED